MRNKLPMSVLYIRSDYPFIKRFNTVLSIAYEKIKCLRIIGFPASYYLLMCLRRSVCSMQQLSCVPGYPFFILGFPASYYSLTGLLRSVDIQRLSCVPVPHAEYPSFILDYLCFPSWPISKENSGILMAP
jgi:hypothetical protein